MEPKQKQKNTNHFIQNRMNLKIIALSTTTKKYQSKGNSVFYLFYFSNLSITFLSTEILVFLLFFFFFTFNVFLSATFYFFLLFFYPTVIIFTQKFFLMVSFYLRHKNISKMHFKCPSV